MWQSVLTFNMPEFEARAIAKPPERCLHTERGETISHNRGRIWGPIATNISQQLLSPAAVSYRFQIQPGNMLEHVQAALPRECAMVEARLRRSHREPVATVFMSLTQAAISQDPRTKAKIISWPLGLPECVLLRGKDQLQAHAIVSALRASGTGSAEGTSVATLRAGRTKLLVTGST